MYEVDERDRVAPLEGVPQSSTGAPLPLIMADDWRVILGYYMASTQTWTGIPRMVEQRESDEAIALIRFERIAHMFGPPNDVPLADTLWPTVGSTLVELFGLKTRHGFVSWRG